MAIFSAVKKLFGGDGFTVVDHHDEAAVRNWLSERLAKQLGTDAKAIDTQKSFEEYGLDSMFAVKVTGELEKIVELRLSPALLFENTCINDVAHVISQTSAAN